MAHFRIRQNNITVAEAEGSNAEHHIWHYAFQYREEGDITIQHKAEGRWKRFAFLTHWPNKKDESK